MNADTVQLVLDAGPVALKFLGGISLVGVMAFVTAYYAFPPNLTVEEVKDKSKHNFESRLIIRNIGKLPAYNVVVDVKNMNFQMGDIHMQNMKTENCGVSTKVLAVSEKMEIPARMLACRLVQACSHATTPCSSSTNCVCRCCRSTNNSARSAGTLSYEIQEVISPGRWPCDET
jgi:hypothetical protein